MATVLDVKRLISGVLTVVEQIEIDKSSTRTRRLMEEDRLNINVRTEGTLDLEVGDIISYDGIDYTLNRPVTERKVRANSFQYNAVFEAPIYTLLNKICLLNGNADFFLVGTAEDFLDLLISNINSIDSGWTKGTVVATTRQNLQFSNDTCRSVLNKIVDAYRIEFNVIGKRINLVNRVENITTTALEYGRGKGLYTIERDSLDSGNTVTRLYAYGGTRNLDSTYRNGAKRLRLATGFIENTTELNKIIERAIELPNIFPSFTGGITAVSSNNLVITVPSIDFNINEQLLEGVEAKVAFVSGDLLGRELTIASYDNVSKQITLNAFTDEFDETIPNSTIHPSIGDNITLIDIKMPQSYIDNAEASLLAEATRFLNLNSKLRVKYTVNVDHRYLRENNISLAIGDVVTIKDDDIGVDRAIRIISTQVPLDNPLRCTFEISDYLDEVAERGLARTLALIQSAQAQAENSIITTSLTDKAFFENTFARLSGDNDYVGDQRVVGGIFQTDPYLFVNHNQAAGSSGLRFGTGTAGQSVTLERRTNGSLYFNNDLVITSNATQTIAGSKIFGGQVDFTLAGQQLRIGYNAGFQESGDIGFYEGETQRSSIRYDAVNNRLAFINNEAGNQLWMTTADNDGLIYRVGSTNNQVWHGGNFEASNQNITGDWDFTVRANFTYDANIGLSNLADAAVLVGSTSNGIGIDANEIMKQGGTLFFGTIDNQSINIYSNRIQRMTIRNDGDIDIFESLKGNGTFTSGFAGSNWMLDPDADGSGNSRLTVDNITVRGELKAYSFEINELLFVGGTQVLTPGGGAVIDRISGNNLFFDTDNGNNPIRFQVGDAVRGQRYTGRGISSFRGRVTAVDQYDSGDPNNSGFITVTTLAGAPTVGMKLVQMGHLTDTDRQNMIYMTAADDDNPYISFLSGVTDGLLSGHERLRIGNLSGITSSIFSNVGGFGFFGEGNNNTGIYFSTTGDLQIRGTITILNPGDINTASLNNDAGWTDDTTANNAISFAVTANTNATAAKGVTDDLLSFATISNNEFRVTAGANSFVRMYFNSNSNFGFEAFGGTTDPVVKLGSENKIANFTIEGDKLSSDGIELIAGQSFEDGLIFKYVDGTNRGAGVRFQDQNEDTVGFMFYINFGGTDEMRLGSSTSKPLRISSGGSMTLAAGTDMTILPGTSNTLSLRRVSSLGFGLTRVTSGTSLDASKGIAVIDSSNTNTTFTASSPIGSQNIYFVINTKSANVTVNGRTVPAHSAALFVSDNMNTYWRVTGF